VEDEEDEKPHLHLFQKILKDSCGNGKYRGGAGITVAWVVQGTDKVVYQSIVKSSRVQALQSLFGGYPPPVHPGIQIRHSDVLSRICDEKESLPRDVYELIKDRSIQGDYEVTTNLRSSKEFAEGDIFVGCSHGGAGYGDVLERDPLKVMKDLKQGIISKWVAREVYHVVYEPDTYWVDLAETARKREKERKNRIKRGLGYDSFMKTWTRQKPDLKILKYYGPWPGEVPHEQLEVASGKGDAYVGQ
jgi:acetophenone carboxylase